jgi:ABC-2 type transport system ATP-binding protein
MTAPRVLLRSVRTGKSRGFAGTFDLALDAGIHVLLGAPADGTLLLGPLVGGLVAPRTGQVLVAGIDPYRTPDLRRRIGVVLDIPAPPRVGTVRGWLDLAALGRSGSPTDSLTRLGLERFVDRSIRSLSRNEARAIELAIALGIPDPVALVLTEPRATMNGRIDFRTVADALAERAHRGACVMIATSSSADATELGGTVHLLDAGRISMSITDPAALTPGRAAELRVVLDDPRRLIDALSGDPAVTAIHWDAEQDRSLVTVRGDDIDRTALAVQRAVVSSAVAVRSISSVTPGLAEIRAAAAGFATAAYHAAYRSYAGAAGWSPPAAANAEPIAPAPPEEPR